MSTRHLRCQDQCSLAEDEPLIHAIREPVSARLAERMRPGEDLVQDYSERPNVNLNRVGVVAASTVANLRCDIWESADLRLEPLVLFGPFGVVEVAEFDPDWEDRGDEDVLEVLGSLKEK